MECGTEGVTNGLEHVAATSTNGNPHEFVMPLKRNLHRLGILIPKAGAPFNIREKKGDRTRRKVPRLTRNAADIFAHDG
jgi:hypothetical protein